jgi:hypothetical protein
LDLTLVNAALENIRLERAMFTNQEVPIDGAIFLASGSLAFREGLVYQGAKSHDCFLRQTYLKQNFDPWQGSLLDATPT